MLAGGIYYLENLAPDIKTPVQQRMYKQLYVWRIHPISLMPSRGKEAYGEVNTTYYMNHGDLDENYQAKLIHDAKLFAKRNMGAYELVNPRGYKSSTSQRLVSFGVRKGQHIGKLKLKKVCKSDNKLVDLAPKYYSLENAVYGLYYDKECRHLVRGLFTKQDGNTKEIELMSGTYYIKEYAPSKGFALDKEVYEVVIKENETTTFTSKEEPLLQPLSLVLKKIDEAKEGAAPLPLKGAIYQLEYYNDLDNIDNAKPIKTWQLSTDEKGQILYKNEYKVAGDDLFQDEKGNFAGPIGTYVFKEKMAPKGFVLDPEKHVIKVMQEKPDSGVLSAFNIATSKEAREKEYKIELQKVDNDTGNEKAEGYGSFEGAVYNVYRDKNNGELVGTITTDSKGYGALGGLHKGTYVVKEVKAPKGYMLDLEEHKVDLGLKDSAKLVEKVTSKEKVREVEVIKTEEGAAEAKESLEGASLELRDEKGTVIESWQTGKEPHKIKGLEAGKTYYIHESKSPEGYKLLDEDVKFQVGEKGMDSVKVVNKKIPPEPPKPPTPPKPPVPPKPPAPPAKTPPTLMTSAINPDTNLKIVSKGPSNVIVDKINYENLNKGQEYIIKGTLISKKTGKVILIDGKPITSETKIIAEDKNGQGQVKFNFDGNKIKEDQLVVFEELQTGGKQVASHKDLNNVNQTITFTSLKTKGDYTITPSKTGHKGNQVKITDTIKYENLLPGKKYKAVLTLANKDDGSLLKKNGKLVKSELYFTADKSSGEIENTINLSDKDLKGKSLVIFEEVYLGDKLVACHKNLSSETQTLNFPDLVTKAAILDKNYISEEISYKNLTPGATYNLIITVIDKNTGAQAGTYQTTLTPENQEGRLQAKIAYDSTSQRDIKDHKLVVTDYLYQDKKLVAAHNDLGNQAQTVTVKRKTPKTGDLDLTCFELSLLVSFILLICIRKKCNFK